MESIKKLSLREKVLLYVLLIIIIVVGGWMFLVSPTLSEHNTLKNEKALLETNVQDSSITIDYSNLDKDYKTTQNKIDEIKNSLNPIMYAEDIDSLFTEKAKNYALNSSTVNISEIKETTLTSYNSKDKKGGTKVRTCDIEQTLTGSYLNVDALLDDIRSNNSIQVTSINYANATDDSFEISYRLYMIEK